MELVVEEAAVSVKVLSVSGKRMSKVIYNQLPRRSPLSDHDCTVQGRLWGVVIDPKCCHSMHTNGRAHWHVVYEREGELAVWTVMQGAPHTPYNLVPGGPYEPRSRIDREFLDVCALETYRGSTGFFQGKVFDLIRDDQVVTSIEDIKVYLTCSAAVPKLRVAKQEHHTAVQRAATTTSRWPQQSGVPNWLAEAAEKAARELEAAVATLERLCDQRGHSVQDLYAALVADVRRIKQARENYAAALESVALLPQLFLGA